MPIPRYAATNTVAMYTLMFPRLPAPAVAGVVIKRKGDPNYAMPSLIRDIWRVNRKVISADVLGDAAAADNTGKVVVEADGTIVVAANETAWARLTSSWPFVVFDADTPELAKAAEDAEEKRISTNPTLPSLFKQTTSLIASVAEWVGEGAPRASKEVYESRLAICKSCPSYEPNGFGVGLGRCRECGCGGAKLYMETSVCPLTKW